MLKRAGLMSVARIASVVISILTTLGSFSASAGSVFVDTSYRTVACSADANHIRGTGLGEARSGAALQSGGGIWALEDVVVTTERILDNTDSYPSNSFTIGDGSYSSSRSWTDAPTGITNPAHGSASINCTWTPPPANLEPGEDVRLTASCEGTFSTVGEGYKNLTGHVSVRYTEDPPADNLAALTHGSTYIVSVGAGGSTTGSHFVGSASEEGSFSVPEGQSGDVLAIVAQGNGPGGKGYVLYKYVAHGSAAPLGDPAPPSAQETDIPWATIIGGIGAVAIGGLAVAATAVGLATRGRRRRPRKNEKGKEEETDEGPVGYLLQLSHDRLALKPGEAAQLGSAVWQVDSRGQYTLASDARISLVPPAGIAALPSEGEGRLNSRIEVRDGGLNGERVMDVEALVGSEQHEASVVLSIQAPYRIEFF